MKSLADGQPLDVISDESTLGFTGPFVGMYASSQGVASENKALYDWFDYEDLKK
jgi:alpha-N-arabinofuranosidase